MTPPERSEWLEHPYTKHLKNRVVEVVDEIKDEWASGKYPEQESNEYARGRIHGLFEIFELE